MPTPPQDPTPEQQSARDLVAQMSSDDIQAFLASWQSGGLFERAPQPPRNVVDLPDPPTEPSLLRVRVDLDGSKPAIWRRLDVRDDLSVEQLHQMLQAAMGWADSHLHRFWLGPKKQIWTGPYLINDGDLDEGEEGVHERDVQVGQVLRAAADRLFYTYDFGDDWTHTIKVEQVLPLTPDAPSAVCIGGRNACPPEDLGGPQTHNELVAAWREAPDCSTMDPQYAQWLPPRWDPTEFSTAQTTQAIALGIALGGASMDEILSLAAMTSLLHPALDDVLSRASDHTRGELARVLEWVHDDDEEDDAETGLDLQTLASAVLPWHVLLGLAGSDGIPLTSAGWMRPAIVQSIYDDLRMEQEWVGKGNREDMTLPVLLLRESAQRLGLLRRRKAMLVLTPAGRAAVNDVGTLWEHLTSAVLPTKPGFVRDACVLWLAGASTSGDIEAIPEDRIAAWLTGLGWRTTEGTDVDTAHVVEAIRDMTYVLAQVSGRSRRRLGPHRRDGDARVVQAFAREALMPDDG